jgi:integrase
MVATLPAGDHTDPATPGLQLRVRQKRAGTSRTWLLRYRWGDEWVRIVLGHAPGMSLSEARDRAQQLRKAIDNGIDPRRARPRRPQRPTTQITPVTTGHGSRNSIEFLVSEFMERHVRPHRKRPEYAQAILERNVLPVWRGRDARTIEPSEVLDLLDGIVDRGSKVMANRTAALLGQLFKFAIHRRIVSTTPVQLLYRPGGKEKPRERALSDIELRAFLGSPTACTRYERLAHIILILLLTGQRRGELALARWSEIDYEARTWKIPDENSKSGRGHVVPLTDWAVREFEALQRSANRSRWVLPGNGGEDHIDPKQLTRSVAKCQDRFQKQGIQPFTLHDLRRTCRTGLARLKIEPQIAERVLNHVQERIPGTYDRHDYLDEKRDALEKWAAHLEKLREETAQ